MSQPVENVGSGYLSLLVWRLARNLLYRAVGLFRPGWRRAIRLVLLLDSYADKGTMNMPLYSDPRSEANIQAMEREIRKSVAVESCVLSKYLTIFLPDPRTSFAWQRHDGSPYN